MRTKKRALALLLAVVTVVTGIPIQRAAAETEPEARVSDSGITLDLSWNESPYVSGDTFTLDTDRSQPVNAVLTVSYDSPKVQEEGYDAGELVITVDGLSSAYRTGNPEYTIGADQASSGEKTRDWSYTWDRRTDTFTLTNNAPIEPGSVFSGYFELVFPMDPRRCTDLYEKDLTATLSLPDGDISSQTLHFAVDTVVDTYQAGIEAEMLYSTHGFSVEYPEDYFWRKYPLDGERVDHSRGVKNGERYELTVPKGAIVYSPYLSVSQTDATHWAVDLETGSEDKNDLVYILYPKESFANQEAEVTLSMYGTYWEGLDGVGVEEEVLLASDSCTTRFPSATDFDFLLPGGDLGGRPHKEDSYPGTGYYGADILGEELQNGKVETWVVTGAITSHGEADPTTLEVVDDFQFISLTDGNWRQLTSADFEHITVHLPSANEITNINGMPLTPDTYTVQVFAATNDAILTEGTGTLVYEGLLGAKEVDVSLPEHTTAVSVRINDLEEIVNSFRYTIDTRYHVQDPDGTVDFETGQLRNILYMMYYNSNGNWIEEDLVTEDNYSDDTNLHLAQKDLDIYGHYQIRSQAGITFYGRDVYQSDFTAKTGLAPFTVTDSSFTSTLTFGSTFSMDQDQRFDRFSLYTIIPEGLNLTGRADTAEKLWDDLTLSGLGLDAATLAEHATLELIPDYQGSGGTYIALHFDVTGLPVDFSQGITASVDVDASRTWYQKNGVAFQVKSAVIIDSDSDYRQAAKYPDDGSWADPVWSDLDHDGDTEERLSFHMDYKSVTYAASSQFGITKYIESPYSNGMVQLPEVADIGLGETYTYTLRLINGASIAKDILVYDNLEQGPNSIWQGSLISVDVSDAQNANLAATVYYSEDPDAKTLDSGEWSTDLDPADAASVAVQLDGELKAGAVLDLKVTMRAPEGSDWKGERTENNYRVCFTMRDAGSGMDIPMDTLESNYVQGRLVAGYKDITVTKADAVNGSALAGAEFALINPDSGETIATATSNAKGYAIFEKIPQDETYLLRETKAPDGYELGEDIEVNLKDKDLTLTFSDPRTPGSLLIRKVNGLDETLLVSGAEYTLYDWNGDVVGTYTTDENGEIFIEDLDWGPYTLRETKAPLGYELDPTEYTVTVSRDTAGETQELVLKDEQSPTSITIVKREKDTSGVELESLVPGALFDLYKDQNGTWELMGTYRTDDAGSLFVEDLAYGSYRFLEKRAPEGYDLDATPIPFTVSPTDPDQEVIVYNQRQEGSIRLFKLDDAGQPVAGGVYELKDTEGKTVGTYTTNANGYVDITGLEWGDYTIQEIKAPNGYLLDETVYPVTIDGTNRSVEVQSTEQRKLGSVVLTKYDETGTQTLSGAVFALYTTDGALLQENLTTDEDGKLQVDGLAWGSYYFQEVTPPVGYGLNDEPVRFSINALTANSVQQVSLRDPLDARTLTVTKRVKADDINFANGDPSFLFTMTGTDVNDVEHEYNRIVTFTEAYVQEHTGEDGYVTQSVTFSGFPAGTYQVVEGETSRFELEGISDVVNGITDGTTVFFDMVAFDSGSCTFTNKTYESQWYSHTAGLSNILKESSVMTGITVLWNGPDTLDSGTKIDRSQLLVYANYDDGTSILLADDLYDLSIEEVPFVSGDYTVDVSYTDADGVTGTGNFTFHVNLTIVPIGVEVTVPEDTYPGLYPLSADDLEYQIVLSNGDRVSIEEGDSWNIAIGDTTPDGYPEQTVAVQVLENKTGTQDVPYTAEFLYKGKLYELEGTFSVNTVHVINNPKSDRIGTWDDANLYQNSAIYVSDSYDAYLFGPGGFATHGGAPYPADAARIKTVRFQQDFSGKYLDHLFVDWTSLETVYNWPSDVQCLQDTFLNCSSLKNVADLPNNPIDLTETFSGCSSLVTAPKLPDVVTEFHDKGILTKTFLNCKALRNIPNMPTEVVSDNWENQISSLTFGNCSSLTVMPKFPEGILSMTETFLNCTALTDVSAGLPEAMQQLSYTFDGCSSLTTTPVVPDSVWDMEGAFINCPALTTVTNFPESLVELSRCFYDENRSTVRDTALVNVPDVIPYGCWGMGDTFYGCTSLTKAPAIPATVGWMVNTFRECINLTEVPALAYTEASDLENGIYVEGEIADHVSNGVTYNTRTMAGAFYGCPVTEVPNIPKGTTDLGYTFGYSDLRITPEIPEGVLIMAGTYVECKQLVKAGDMPDTVLNIESTYQACSRLQEIGHLSNGATSMRNTCYGCAQLRIVENLPDHLTNMTSAFAYCLNLESVPDLPDTVQNMGSAFQSCNKLKKFPGIPASVTNLYYTYAWCYMLTDISCTIPSTVTSMASTFRNIDGAYGTITINKNPNEWNECFAESGADGPGIILTGTCTKLEEIAATGQYVTVQ